MSDEHDHYYGGQAVLEGVMMRSKTAYATAVRRSDGSVIVGTRKLSTLAQRYGWAKWPLIRGNVALLDALTLGLESLNFSGNVALEDEARQQEAEREEAAAGDEITEQAPPQKLGEQALWLTMIPALLLGLGLFVVLPAWAVDWIMGAVQTSLAADTGDVLLRNLVEGGLRLMVIVGYIAAISLIPYVRRVFEYHGAEHATINAFETTGEVTVESALKHSPLHPRCGTAFILVVILVKIILGCFVGWPVAWLRVLLRLALLPPVAGIAYEIIYWAGRHRNSMLSRVLAAPGLFMQKLTTRRPSPDQVEVAIYALATVAPEVDLPEDLPEPERVAIGGGGRIIREPAPEPEAAAGG